jgi:hypothetical protein
MLSKHAKPHNYVQSAKNAKESHPEMNVRPSFVCWGGAAGGLGCLVSLEMYHDGWMVLGLNTIALILFCSPAKPT